MIARELEIDPIDVRRRNYVHRGEPPLAMLTGQPFVGVTTQECVEQAAKVVDWDGFRRRPGGSAGREGRYLGLGIASYLEAAPGPGCRATEGNGILGDEVTHISVEDDGIVAIVTRQQPHGQGHETTLAQVAVDELGVNFEDVHVIFGDTDVTPMALVGTGGSRAATMANGVVLHASRQLREQVLSLAADVLEANAADLEIGGGVISVARHAESSQLSLSELARIVTRSRSGSRRAPTTELKVTRDLRRRRERLVRRHPLLRGRGRHRNRFRHDQPVRRGRGLRAARQPGHRRGPDPRRRGAGRSGRCSSSTPPTARTASSSPPRSWTT